MDDKDIKIDFDSLDNLLDKLADKNKQIEFDFDYPLFMNSAATISTSASSNAWPYVYSKGNYNYNYSNISSNGLTFNDFWDNTSKQTLSVKGDAEFEGDVKIKGKSLNAILDKIEERLAILHPNQELEDSWQELKKLGDAYRALEKDIIQKEKIWETLKK